MPLYIILKKRGSNNFSRSIKVKKYRSRTNAVKEARRIFGKDYLVSSVIAKNLNNLRKKVKKS